MKKAPLVPLPDSFRDATILVAAVNETHSLRQTVKTLLASPDGIREIILLLSPKITTPECLAVARELAGETETPKFRDSETPKSRNPEIPKSRETTIPIRIVFQTRPFAGGAYQDGFDAALGSHVLMMSADLETDPATVPEMLAEARRHPGAVIATSRWIRGGGFRGYNPVKQVCNAIFQPVISLLYGTRLTDLTFGFRVFPVSLVQAIDWKELRHPFFLETCVAPLRLGVPFVEIPTRWRPRPEGESQNSFFANFRYFRTAFRVRFASPKSLLKKEAPPPTPPSR